MSTQIPPRKHDLDRSLGRFLRAPTRLQTYRNLLYLLLMFPLGLVYLNLIVVGFAVGLSLAIVVVGVPIIVLLLAVVVGLAGLERALVRLLLGVDLPPTAAKTERDLLTRTKQLVIDRRTWRAVVYLLSVAVFGTLVFGLIGSLVATAVSLLFAPVYYRDAPVVAYGPIPDTNLTLDVLFGWDDLLVGLTTTFQIGSWDVETLSGALLCTVLGIVLLFCVFQLVNGLALIWGRYAKAMLTTPRYWNVPAR